MAQSSVPEAASSGGTPAPGAGDMYNSNQLTLTTQGMMCMRILSPECDHIIQSLVLMFSVIIIIELHSSVIQNR